MGTRGLTAVMVDGEYKIAQYGQFDHYPDGHGARILNFCQESDMDIFREKVRNTQWATAEYVDQKWVECGATEEEMESGYVRWEVGVKLREEYPNLSREASSDILNIVYEDFDGEVKLIDSIDFAGDSLFCEWAYVIDLDKNTFEVYKGFNTAPVEEGERFANAPYEVRPEGSTQTQYYPVTHLRTWSLNDLPSEENFKNELNALAYPEEEEDIVALPADDLKALPANDGGEPSE